MEISESHDQQSEDQSDQDNQTQLPELEVPELSKHRKRSMQPEKWSSGLFGCMKSPCNECVTLCCPCVTFGQIAEIVDEGHISCCVSAMVSLGTIVLWFFGLPCGTVKLLSTYRAKLRKKYNIVESPAHDWAVHSVCCFCGLCQEYRELKHRGFKPSMGWKKNKEMMEKNKNQKQNMNVPPNQRMNRT